MDSPVLMLSFRERIMELLMTSSEPLSVNEIARILEIDPSQSWEIYDHLEHIARTVRAKYGKLLLMDPPYCKKCGYVFKDLKKPKKPSRCPRCGSEWIEPPRFIIK
jgi:predicted Zn-ribbon and HTH transcriptional regulator